MKRLEHCNFIMIVINIIHSMRDLGIIGWNYMYHILVENCKHNMILNPWMHREVDKILSCIVKCMLKTQFDLGFKIQKVYSLNHGSYWYSLNKNRTHTHTYSSHSIWMGGIFLHNIVMDLNNVMCSQSLCHSKANVLQIQLSMERDPLSSVREVFGHSRSRS